MSDTACWLRHHGALVSAGLCHGARAGQEVDWYQEEFPRAKFWGTDLFLKGHPKIVQCDFSEPNPKWIGAFDIVYSNALDHALDPMAALKVWADQLKPLGHLLIQWSRWHVMTRGGDCFGAQFHEYLGMLNSVARVIDVLYHYSSIVTIVSEKKR